MAMPALRSSTYTFNGQILHLDEEAVGTWMLNGTRLPIEDGATLYDAFTSGNRFSVNPTTEFGKRVLAAALDAVSAIEGAKPLDFVRAAGRILSAGCDFIGAPATEPVSLKGLPQANGEPEAGHAVVQAVKVVGSDSLLFQRYDLAAIESQSSYLTVTNMMKDTCQATLDKIAANAAPATRYVYDKVKKIRTALSPILGTHEELATIMKPAVTYLDERHNKGKVNRKRNIKRDKTLVQKTTTATTAAVRSEARAEAVAEVQDRLSGLVTKK